MVLLHKGHGALLLGLGSLYVFLRGQPARYPEGVRWPVCGQHTL